MTITDRPTLSIAQTAELLGISRWLVQQAVRDGSLPSLRLGRRVLIPTARLQAWIAGGAAAPPDPAARTSGSIEPGTSRTPRARAV